MSAVLYSKIRWVFVLASIVTFLALAGIPGRAVELTFLCLAWQPSTVQAIEEIVAQWNQSHPDIQVKIVWQSWENVNDFLLTSFQGGEAPDIFHQDSIMCFEYGVLGYAEPLNDYLDEEILLDIPDHMWDSVRDDNGRIYGIPFLQETLVVFYNKAMFANAGIVVPPDGMVSWEELLDYAKRLTVTDASGKVITWGLLAPLEQRLWWCLVAQNEGRVLCKYPDGTWHVDIDDNAREAIRFYTDMVTLHKVMPQDIISYDFLNLIQGFVRGRYAMVTFGCWARSWLERLGSAKLDWGMLQIRGPKVNVTEADPQAIGLWAGSPYKKEAVEFMKFLTNTENSAKIAYADWLFPVRQSALARTEFQAPEHQWNVAYQWLPFARDVKPRMFGFFAWEWQSFIPQLELVILGQQSLDEALEKATRDGNAFLRRLGLQ